MAVRTPLARGQQRQQPGDWRLSLLHQVEIFDRMSQLAEQVLRTSPDSRSAPRQ
jgi:hypothetical protein